MDLDVVFIGTAGAAPSARRGPSRNTSSEEGANRLLFDCGEGDAAAAPAQRRAGRPRGGLPHALPTPITCSACRGMLKSFALRDRETPLTIYGPPGLQRAVRDLRADRRPPALRADTAGARAEPGAEPRRLPRRRLRGHPSHARVRVCADRGLAPGAASTSRRRSNSAVTPGPDFGKLQKGEPVGDVQPDQVLGEPRRGRKVVLSGDTTPVRDDRARRHGADLLVHEATLTPRRALARARDRALDPRAAPRSSPPPAEGSRAARALPRLGALRRVASCATRRAPSSLTP